ncbi:MAG: SIMPL domain-containing protein [Bacteroidaceae bacterium]
MKNLRIEALVLAVGLMLLGLFVKCGLTSFAARDRIVSVKGLAEREVKADKVIWPLIYKTVGNDPSAIYTHISTVNARILNYLKRNGITNDEISIGAPQIIDIKADRYASASEKQTDRYNVSSIITVSTNKVDAVRGMMARMGELLKEGIAISAGDYNTSVEYDFTSLNKIKPQMIEEATNNAREGAMKFAKDSESQLGKIKNASQGLFTIENRDANTPYIKKVRVVTNVDYYLDN